MAFHTPDSIKTDSPYPWITLYYDLPQYMLERGRKKKYGAYTILGWEGDPCPYCYFVVKGAVRYYISDKSGTVRTLGIVLPGAFLAEACILVTKTWMFTAETLTDSELYSFNYDELISLIETDPKFAVQLVKALSVKMIVALSWEKMAMECAEDRVKKLLPRLESPPFQGLLSYHFTHQDIADLVACHRVTVSKVMQKTR
ncbi:MAG: Crp/Fnr family transcriptional regulator [Dethiobacter sp.]|nr:MAG: Crp/Fnr family transcriptional regulator [Dethiobacter sp.]